MINGKTYYEILGVEQNATDADIKSAYRKLAKKYHPDLNKDNPQAAERFREVNAANEVLSNPQSRAQYDMQLKGGFAGGFAGASGFNGAAGFDTNDIFGDIFSQFFGDRGMGGQRKTVNKGENVVKEIKISFLDAVLGSTHVVTYNCNQACPDCKGTGAKNGTAYEKCSHCDGSGQVRMVQNSIFGQTVRITTCPKCNGTGKKIIEKCPTCHGKTVIKKEVKIPINIPAGVDNDNYITKTGAGHAPIGGGINGDLIIVFKVEKHPLFQRENLNLHIQLPIDLQTAIAGGKVGVPLVDGQGQIMLDIPSGSQSGKKFLLRGRGITTSNGKGDMVVELLVEIPHKFSSKQLSLLAELAESLQSEQQPILTNYKKTLRDLYGPTSSVENSTSKKPFDHIKDIFKNGKKRG